MQRRIYQYEAGRPISAFGPDLYSGEYLPTEDRGGWSPSDWNTLIDNISDSIADVLVGGRDPRSQYPGSYRPLPATQNQMNWPLVIGGILIVLVLLVLLKK